MKFTVNSNNKPLAVFHKLLVAMFLVGTFLVGGQTALALGYHEYENPPCYDVTGSTTALLVGGVNNGGIMNFDDAGVDLQYQACVRMSAAGPTGVPQRLEGWVWNDNMGWVSMYCPGGAGATNFGIACGARAYSVTFAPSGGVSPDFVSVPMSGAAWGDNIGYISFNSAFHQMKPTPNGASRGLVSAGSPVAEKYAWADSVGWLDYSGVTFRWVAEPVVPQLDDVQILSPDPLCDLADECVPTVAQTPVADGGQSYTIEIPFKDGAVDLTDADIEDCGVDSIGMYATSALGKPYCARVKLEWQDSVDYNQTSKAHQNSATNPYNLTSAPGAVEGAVIKPLLFTLTGGDLTYDGLKKIWGANVSSFAPTSDGNLAEGMQLEKFNYVNTAQLNDPTYDYAKTDQDRLRLAKVNLMLFKYSTGAGVPGQCIMGEVKDPSPIAPPNPYTCNLHTYVTDINMPFKPLFEVSKLVHRVVGPKDLNFINIDNVEGAQQFDYQLVKNALTVVGSYAAQFDIGLANDPNYALTFDDDASNRVLLTESGSGSLFGKIITLSPGGGASFSGVAQPYLFSKISYVLNTKPVSYYANKLPRIAAGILKNPVAKVQGNVYLTDYAAKTSDMPLRSLGNISSNLRREQIVRNVNKYLRGYAGAPIVTTPQTVSTGVVGNVANYGMTELVTDKVFYIKGANLTINCGGTCAFDRDVTFIVENGNIFVNSDIEPAPGVQVGLIALRNLDGNIKTQGFLYLEKNVKWLSRVQIYLDRVLQSYDATVASGFDTNGFYKIPGNDSARQTLFKDQLVMEGTISSMNGIGNASANPATDEEGNSIGAVAGSSCADYGAATLTGICRARVTDLNYLRYYGPGLEICDGSEEGTTYTALPNIPRDQLLKLDDTSGYGCNPNAPLYDIDASELFEVQTWGDLISGGAAEGLPSPYFSGMTQSFQNQFPVNFFYVPISPDLAGFEQEQDFNPVIQ